MSLKSQISHAELNISMENTEKLSLAEIRAFLQASQEVRFEATGRQEIMYEWVARTLCYQQYCGMPRRGDSTPAAGHGATSAAGNFQRRAGTKSQCSKRHTGRRKHAGRQVQTVREKDTSEADT